MKKVKKTVIFTSYDCNNQCVFCIDSEKRSLPGKTTEELKREMVGARKRGATYLELIGGELTIRPDAIPLVRFAKKLGFKDIVMSTNGRVYSYPEYTRKMLAAGLTHIIFSIHGHNAATHDALTRTPGSFEQLLAGFNNFVKLGFDNIGSNTTIVKQNYKYLPEIGEFIYSLGVRNAEFIFVDPNYGGANKDFHKLVPKISDVAPYAHKCLDIGKQNNIGHWHIRYVPLCYFTDYLDQVSELEEVKRFQTEHIAPDFENYDVEGSRAAVGRVKASQCKKCRLDNMCEGIWKAYVEKYGDGELTLV